LAFAAARINELRIVEPPPKRSSRTPKRSRRDMGELATLSRLPFSGEKWYDLSSSSEASEASEASEEYVEECEDFDCFDDEECEDFDRFEECEECEEDERLED
jgi:hypothetical protein